MMQNIIRVILEKIPTLGLEFLIVMRDLFLDMGPYLLLGITVSGILHVLLNKEMVAKHIGKRNFSSIFKAAFFGVPLPLCSCGVVPAANFLKKSGASKPSVVSFLISTPQTGVDSIAATYGIMGPVLAIFRPIAALFTGLIGGVISLLIKDDEKENEKDERKNVEIQDNHAGHQHTNPKDRNLQQLNLGGKIKKAFNYAYIESIDEIAVNFIVGLLLAGVITMIIPEGFFDGTLVGKGILGMIFMIIVGIPMYICSSSSIPVAAAFIAKGISPGVAFVFLAAGPATNAASLKMIDKTLGRKQTIAFLISIIVGSMTAGLILDGLVSTFNLSVIPHSLMEHSGHLQAASPFKIATAGIFGLLILGSLFRIVREKWRTSGFKKQTPREGILSETFNVEGMTCKNCQSHVNKAILGVSGVDNVQIDLKTGHALVMGDFSKEKIIQAVKAVGYKSKPTDK